MKSHNDNDNQKYHKEHKHKGHMKHMWLMVLCCAMPIIFLLALPFFDKNDSFGFLPYAIFLLCPLMHIFMMPMMHKKQKNQQNDNENKHDYQQIDHK